MVNGNKVCDPAFLVCPQDHVVCDGTSITHAHDYVYVLLNKPTGFVTTLSDPYGRPTVIDLIKDACAHRIYPVGRLDFETSGLLLLTNDGTLAHKLSHPKHEVRKVYEVTLTTPLTEHARQKLSQKIMLHDGPITIDSFLFPEPEKFDVIRVSLHSGRNRIVRRIFKFLGHPVRLLDRIEYAELLKSNLKLGAWRYLTAQEVQRLHEL